MSVYNSAAMADAMNSAINNVMGGETTPENFNGTVNLGKYIKNPRDILINNVTGRTVNGLTITTNSDGTFNVVGTATSTTNIMFYNNAVGSTPTTVNTTAYQKIPRGKYIAPPSPKGGGVNVYLLACRYGSAVGSSTERLRFPVESTTLIDNTNGDFDYCMFYFSVWSGQTVNLTVNPYLKKV